MLCGNKMKLYLEIEVWKELETMHQSIIWILFPFLNLKLMALLKQKNL